MDKQDRKYAYFPSTKEELHDLVSTTYIDLSAVDISKITDMSELFLDSNRTMFYGIDTWDVSHVTNMASMFSGAVNFNGDISMWDTSNVEDMSYMFSGAEFFHQDMSRIFSSRY